MDEDESAKSPFQAALSKFKARLGAKERDDFKITTLEDVRHVIARIQDDQEGTKQMMNMYRIQSFLEAMEQFSKIIEVFLNASNFVAFIWGPMKFLLQVASTWADSFDTLLDAYEQIGEVLPLLDQYNYIFDHNKPMRRVLGLIYTDILEFHKRAIRFFDGRVWKQIFSSVWKDFKTRFNGILDSLRRHKELIRDQANVLQYDRYQQDSQNMFLFIQQYEQDRIRILEHVEKSEEEESEKKYLAAMTWMASAETKLDHESFCDVRREYPGSGDWILKHEKVQNWREADTPVQSILWLNGIPGAGKTILASVIIDACTNDRSFNTSYFYCKSDDPEKITCSSILKGLLSQLLTQCRELTTFCYEKQLSSGELILSSPTLAKTLLLLFCHKIQKQYIIIDGLDECDQTERKLVLACFSEIVSRCDAYQPGKLRVLFVSQVFTDIKNGIPAAAVASLTPADNERDIRAYVKDWCGRIQRKFDLDSEQVDSINQSTCYRAEGMFLFAKLVMPNLFEQPRRKELLEEIAASRFPKGLDEAYERIMSRIKQNVSPSEWKIAQKLLGWMVCARRPLKWPEIQGAISIDPVEQKIEFDDRKLRVHIRDLCGSLIQVLPGDRVELVHNTAKFYIKSSGHVCEATTECNLTALCLQYLTFGCFDKDIEPESLRGFALNGYFAFQDYAIAKWFHHFHMMVKLGGDLFKADNASQAALREIESALEDFTSNYEEDILQEPTVPNAEEESNAEEACAAFRNGNFYANLLALWSHIYRHEHKGFEARNNVSLPTLSEVLTRNRTLLEHLLSHPSSIGQDLDAFYGPKRFKCPKLTCFYFHEGFKDSRSRDTHIDRHNRPFNCTFPDCSVTEFGFSSNKDLDRHLRRYHPDVADQATSFSTARATPVLANTPWVCPFCDKKFTRGFHQRNHIRSHKGEKPYACPECGKAFTRLNDCKRHEKIHARR